MFTIPLCYCVALRIIQNKCTSLSKTFKWERIAHLAEYVIKLNCQLYDVNCCFAVGPSLSILEHEHCPLTLFCFLLLNPLYPIIVIVNIVKLTCHYLTTICPERKNCLNITVLSWKFFIHTWLVYLMLKSHFISHFTFHLTQLAYRINRQKKQIRWFRGQTECLWFKMQCTKFGLWAKGVIGY